MNSGMSLAGNQHFHFVTNDVQDAADLDAGLLFVDEVNRNVNRDFAVCGNAQEVDVHREIADRVQLVVLRQNGDLFAVQNDGRNRGHETTGMMRFVTSLVD